MLQERAIDLSVTKIMCIKKKEGLHESSHSRRNSTHPSWNCWVRPWGVSFTHQKKDIDVGPVQLSHKETNTVPISPILTTISLIAGVGLVVVGVRIKQVV